MSCQICIEKFCAYKVPIFNRMSCDELEEIFKLVEHKDYKKGEVLFQEGGETERLYILNEGRLKLYKHTKEGREQILHILREGNFYGELQILKKTSFECSAKAITDCNISTIKKDQFQKLIVQNPQMGLNVIEVIAERLTHLEKRAVMLADNDGDAKIAYLLMELAEEYGQQIGDEMSITLPISKEEMANYAGVTRETMSRKLKSFADMGIIKMTGHKQLGIIDYRRLQEMI